MVRSDPVSSYEPLRAACNHVFLPE